MIVIRMFILTLIAVGCAGKNPSLRRAASLDNPAGKMVQTIRNGNMTVTSKYLSGMDKRKKQNSPADVNDKYRFFNIKFDKGGTQDLSKEKILYTDFDMQPDFALVIGRDSIMPAICQKIQNGLAGSYEYLVAFDGSKQNHEYTLVYRDKIFGIGTIAFIYNQRDIDKMPGLN